MLAIIVYSATAFRSKIKGELIGKSSLSHHNAIIIQNID